MMRRKSDGRIPFHDFRLTQKNSSFLNPLKKTSLDKLETTLVDLEEDYAAMKEGKKLFETFLKKVKSKPNCPLCEHDLGSRRSRVEELCRSKMEFSNESSLKVGSYFTL